MSDYDSHWKTLIDDIRVLESAPLESYCNRLYNKASNSQRAKQLKTYLQGRDRYPPDDVVHADDETLDERNIFILIGRLADASLAKAVADIDEKYDTLGLKKCINTANTGRTDLQLATNLFSFCLAEHINFSAQKAIHRTLRDLVNLEGFAKYVYKKVTDKWFIQEQITHDVEKGNYFFSVCTLFICDYLHKRPSEPETWGAGPLPAYDDKYKESPSFGVVKEWERYMWENGGKTDKKQMDKIVEFVGKASSQVFCPSSETGHLEPQPAWDIIQGLHRHIVASASQSEDDQLYVQHVKDSLQRLEHRKETINAWKSYCASMHALWKLNIASEWQNAISSGLAQKDEGLIQWVRDGLAWELNFVEPRERIFVKSSSLALTETTELGVIATTQISLKDGSKLAVEMLGLDAPILVHQQSIDEPGSQVELHSSAARGPFVGFNGEKPFASAAQVFHTSTGLRAVNPDVARSVNPLAKIGKLHVGHVLYRLREEPIDGHPTYEFQEIKSIEIADLGPQVVYNVSGSNVVSYHANGYVIDTNNLEIHTAMAIESLRQIPASQLMIYLASVPELTTVFKTHDVTAIYERVHGELYGKTRPSADGPAVFTRKQFTSLEERHEAIEADAWSRSSGVSVECLDLHLKLNGRHIHNYQMPSVRIVDGILVLDGHVQHDAVFDQGRRTFRWSRQLPLGGAWGFEHGALRIFPDGTGGCGAIQLSSSLDAMNISKDSLIPFEAVPAVAAKAFNTYRESSLPSGSDKDLDIITTFFAEMKYDKKSWPADSPQPTSPDLIDGDRFDIAIYYSEQKGTELTVTAPMLDKLQTQINQKFGSNLSTFYTSTIETTKTGFTAHVEVDAACLMPFISSAGADMPSNFNLDFNSTLGIDFKLPLLFQSMQIDFDMDSHTATGALFEYHPLMRGLNGDRHFIKGDMDVPSVEGAKSTTELRAMISNSFAAICPRPGVSSNESRSGLPALITKELDRYSPAALDGLKKLDYKSDAIHTTSQENLLKALYFHMTQKQRDILRISPPTDLPKDLTDGLPQKIQDFLRDEYAPAFIGQMTSSVSEYEKELEASEREKIWYWFQGQGDKCMSKRQEYSDLNNLTSILAVKQIHERELAPYLVTETDAKRWATDLHKDMGYLEINKICMLMNVLDANDDFATDWFQKVIVKVRALHLTYPWIAPDETPNKQYMEDAMRNLIEAVLRGDQWIAADVRQGLLKDLEEFEKANNIEVVSDITKRANNIMVKMAVFNGELAKWLSSITQVVKKAFNGTRLFTWMGEAFEKVAGKVTGIMSSRLMKGIAVFAMGAFYVFQVGLTLLNLYKNWDTMEPAQRATVILETLRVLCDAAGSAKSAWSRYKKTGEPTKPQDFLDAAELDQQTGKNLEAQAKGLEEMGEKVYGKKGLRNAVAEGMAEKAPSSKLKRLLRWNESRNSLPQDLPGDGEKAAKKFSIQGNFLRILNVVIGVGVTICMTMSLIRDWGDLNTVGKILETATLIIQFLTVAVDIAEIVVEVFAITGVFAVTLPVFGAILAVLGIIVMILGFFLNGQSEKAPPDPVKEYIKNDVKPFVKRLVDAPRNKLTYDVQPRSMGSGTQTTLNINMINNSGSDVTLKNTSVVVTGGSDQVCLFTETEMQLVESADPKKDSPGYLYLNSSSTAGGSLTNTRLGTTSKYFKYTLDIFGPRKDKEDGFKDLVLKKDQTVTLKWTGTVNKAGKCLVDITERWVKDNAHAQFSIVRT